MMFNCDGAAAAMEGGVLVLTDHAVLPLSAVLTATTELGYKGSGQNDPLIIEQASSISNAPSHSEELPIESSSKDIVIVSRMHDLPGDHLLLEIFRVLRSNGTILIQMSLSTAESLDETVSTLKRQLMLSGFLNAQNLDVKQFVSTSDVNYATVKASKPSWEIGSSFSIKKTTQSLPKVQIDDDMDLIDEDSLLTEEDLKKPQIPIGDCEIGSTRKACKNCTCGRAEEEEKVVKLGLTTDQLNNPQSACGSCGLGDAFRCGTCPYKGLPPFKLGEKVLLTDNFLMADV
ncbi:hypothetical protein Syun_017797 [Stephania yunnanensis]|uniref:Anamorsin homolog n=1 Tax=Stephania yunnanensis TaxID=152371 RepID=A0AAP0J9B4_9MAGN